MWAEPLLFKCSLLPFRHDSLSRLLLTNLHFICTHMDLSSLFVSTILLPNWCINCVLMRVMERRESYCLFHGVPLPSSTHS